MTTDSLECQFFSKFLELYENKNFLNFVPEEMKS